MEIIDFSHYPLSGRYYGGSERKLGILIGGSNFMLKFQKIDPVDFRFNHISEYLGSHIYKMLGFDVQETILGTYEGNEVVACRDFVEDGFLFVPFNDVGESTIEEDRERFQYSYDDIVSMLQKNRKLTNVEDTVSLFFKMYVVDALLGNFDRHGGNWGFLKKNDAYEVAPIFDNGSCLFPRLADEKNMEFIMHDEKETAERVYGYPTSQIKLEGKKSSYFEVISSLRYEGINEALKEIVPLVKLDEIYELIEETPFISDVHKRFYRYMVGERYKRILLYSYDRLLEKEQ